MSPQPVRGPNLFVAGAPKCGTTSMHDYLRQHPEIFMTAPTIKEPLFYLYEDERPHWTGPGDQYMVDNIVVDRAEYLALFADAGSEPYRGESSPYYLWGAQALRKIVAEVDEPRFILMLRDPADRAQSLWRHLWGLGRETARSVDEAMALEDERRELGWEPFWQYRGMGLYGRQLEAMLAIVPREQVHIVFYDSFATDPGAAMSRVFAWLGVAGDVQIDTARRLMVTPHLRDTRANRALQGAVSRKGGYKRFVPPAIRARVATVLIARLNRAAASTQGAAAAETGTPVTQSTRDAFREDIALLRSLVDDVPPSWSQDG